MRDPRFPTQAMFRTDLLSRARPEKETWVPSVVDLLHAALRESRWLEYGRGSSALLSQLAGRLADLRSEGIPLAEGMVTALESSFDSQADNVISAQAAWCWGLALGRCASEAHGARELHVLMDYASHDAIMTEALLSCLGELVSNNHPGILAALEEDIRRVVDAPDSFIIGRKPEGYTQLLAAWKEKPPYDAFDLRTLGEVPLFFPFLAVIGRLRQVDTTAYLRWLDRLPNPKLIEHAFRETAIAEDFDEISRLVRMAPTACAGGQPFRWTSFIAPTLLETALGHVRELLIPFVRPGRDEQVYKQLCDDLSNRMEGIACVLDGRPDGCSLVAHWLIRLVRMRTQENALLAISASIAISALIKVFGSDEAHAEGVAHFIPSARLLSVEEEETLKLSGVGWPSPGYSYATDFLIARLFLKASRQDANDFEDERREFGSLLLVRDAGLTASRTSNEISTWRHRLVMCTLLGPDIVPTWTRYWDQLEEQRRRGKHLAFTSDYSADDPSLFLCSTALSRLEVKEDELKLDAVARPRFME